MILQEMKKPDPFDIKHIKRFIDTDQMQINGDDPLIGPDRKIWGSPEEPKSYSRELVVLRARKDMDTFSQKAGSRAMRWLMKLGAARWMKIDPRWGTVALHDDSIFKFTFWITSAIAPILPVVSIIILVNTHSLTGRLGTIAAFNVIISACLTFFTDARRTDVFAVNAA
jgi:hypothetical protein